MTTYAIVLTALLAGIVGYVVRVIEEEIRDRITQSKIKTPLTDEEQMEQAVKLVSDELGATPILDYDKVN